MRLLLFFFGVCCLAGCGEPCEPDKKQHFVQLTMVSLTDSIEVNQLYGAGQPRLVGQFVIPVTSIDEPFVRLNLPLDSNADISTYIVAFDSIRSDTIVFAYVRNRQFKRACGYQNTIDETTIHVAYTSFSYVDQHYNRSPKVIFP